MISKEIVIDMRELIDNIKAQVNNNQSVKLKGEGESMKPFIVENDILTLKKSQKDKTKVGEIYLYRRYDGSYAIHRVYALKKDFVLMLGDAQLFIEKVSKEDLVAIVTTVQKQDNVIDCTDTLVRFKCVVKMKNRILKVRLKFTTRRLLKKTKKLLCKAKRLIFK